MEQRDQFFDAAGGLDVFDNGCGCRFHIFFVNGDARAVVDGADAGEAVAPFLGDDASFGDVGEGGMRAHVKFFKGSGGKWVDML